MTFNVLPARASASVRGTSVRNTSRNVAQAVRGGSVVRACVETEQPAEAVAAVAEIPKASFMDVMGFGGWAPETINGRVAQIAFVAGVGAEMSTGESFATQFVEHWGAIIFAGGLITLASFMPNLNLANGYTSNPASKPEEAPFTVDAERANGRAAMVGLVAMIATETFLGGPLLASRGDTQLFGASDNFFDEKFKTEVVEVAEPAAPTAFASFADTVIAPAPAAAPAIDEYEAVVAIREPLRVEGTPDAEVEAEAIKLGREVLRAEEEAEYATEIVAAAAAEEAM